ncbi:UPF0575 protein C19orf67 homolog isoform X2 [Stigmatopora nigra]
MSRETSDIEDILTEPLPGTSIQEILQVALNEEVLSPPCGHLSPSFYNVTCSPMTPPPDLELQGCSHKYENRELLVGVLRSFINACQPYFHFLESTGRYVLSHENKHKQLLELSQEMCNKLECLMLKFASQELITLDESDPQNMCHFRMGHLKVKRLKLRVTSFRYCKPTPYLTRVNTGIFKRMRWNVEPYERANNTACKYYFMCYEDFPNPHTDTEHLGFKAVQIWSIGQWVQLKPDPDMESICDWVLCDVPEGTYKKLLDLGIKEPSSSEATDLLLQLLESEENLSFDWSQLSSPLNSEEEIMQL